MSGHTSGRLSHAPSAFISHSLAMWVEVFFALSGFLIAGPWLKALVAGEPFPSGRGYVIKRAGRILPAYWLALTVMLVMAPQRLHWWQYPVHALLVQNLVPGQFQAVMFVAWTLSLEMICYVTIPLFVMALRRLHPGPWRVDVLAAVIGGGWLAVHVMLAPMFDVMVAHTAADSPWRVPMFLMHGLPAFGPGMIVYLGQLDLADRRAKLWRAYEWLLHRPYRAISVALTFAVVARVLLSSRNAMLAQRNGTFSTIAAALVLAVVVRTRPSGRLTRVLAAAGTISYGIYLWHWVARVTLPRLGLVFAARDDAVGYGIHLAELLIVSLTLATLSWVLIEQPILRACRRWARTRTGPAPTRPPTTLPAPIPVLAAVAAD